MKVLLLGQGAREHALAWKLSQSPLLKQLYCAPGNVGTAQFGQNLDLRADDASAIAQWAAEHDIQLVVVGPEAPLVAGVTDALEARGIPVFGPSKQAASLEGSKAFAKDVMQKAGVPTAAYEVFHSFEEAEARARAGGAVVLKADGLAAGKGVVVAQNTDEAVKAVQFLRTLGQAASTVLFEELLVGEEVSVIALCDGERFVLLPPAQDHKRLLDDDKGPNTGGMGAYSPVPFFREEALQEVADTVFRPTLGELSRRGMPFRGALYAGLMLTSKGPKVLEFNCRLGDPEAQVLMMQTEEDLLPVFEACAKGALTQSSLRWSSGASVGVVLAAAGYPTEVRTGDDITEPGGPNAAAQVFYAGVKQKGHSLVTAGGRVMTVCAHAQTFEEARQQAYQAVDRIQFQGRQFRKDIGDKRFRVL